MDDPEKRNLYHQAKEFEIKTDLLVKIASITQIDLFVICLNYQHPRSPPSLERMFRIFQEMFGYKLENQSLVKDHTIFWDRCVVIFTNAKMDNESIEDRMHYGKITDDEKAEGKIKSFVQCFPGGPKRLKYFFIDSHYLGRKGTATMEAENTFIDQTREPSEYLFNSERPPAMTRPMTQALHELQQSKYGYMFDL